MNIDLSQIKSYEEDMAKAKSDLEKAKRQLEYNRLQIKQSREALKRAKASPLIKAFIKAMPKDHVDVMPAPQIAYVSVVLSCLCATCTLTYQANWGLP